MSRDRIKWIVMAAMLVDHAAIVFLPADGVLYWIARQVIGRAAYPLFLTLFLEGALHWRNSWRHAADLVLFQPDRLQSNATFSSPHELTSGIDTVWVNGKIRYSNQQIIESTEL